jgi:hypothetical protein
MMVYGLEQSRILESFRAGMMKSLTESVGPQAKQEIMDLPPKIGAYLPDVILVCFSVDRYPFFCS